MHCKDCRFTTTQSGSVNGMGQSVRLQNARTSKLSYEGRRYIDSQTAVNNEQAKIEAERAILK